MKKLTIIALASIFFFASSASIASEKSSSKLNAEDWQNYILCQKMNPDDMVKSRNRIVNGKIPSIKCKDAIKIVEDARN